MEEYIDGWRAYGDFEGDASLREYWMFKLIHWIIIFLLYGGIYLVPQGIDRVLAIILLIYMAATIIPNISIAVRRLHDSGRSGAWYFVSFVPIIGGIWLLILLCDS